MNSSLSSLDQHKFTIRPWGKFIVLNQTNTYKVKEITVNVGQRLSYQFHNFREEFWTIVNGESGF